MRDTDTQPATEHVDAVVVGSGFGGSVVSYRLAEAGKSVVLLERGHPYPPGSFPRTPRQMGQAFWDPSEGLHGLFDVWRFGGFDSLVSSGLGGGSLIYANVLLRKDEHWFVHNEPIPGGGYEHWPVTRADLDPHYDAVERMIGTSQYPLGSAAYRNTRKTQAFIDAADKQGLPWQLPPLAISFASTPGAEPTLGMPIVASPYGNIHGAERRTCRLVGECDIGCNDGAKNSLDHTYLSAAQHHGADIRTRREVRGFRPLAGGGYEVAYVQHDPAAEGSRTDTAGLPLQLITCRHLLLGAGAYGTTYLLLRNRDALPGLSSALGSRFSGNGDLLTFLLPKRGPTPFRELNASYGPVITAAVRVGDASDGNGATGRGFYVEDGGYPGFTDWLVQSADLTGGAFRVVESGVRWLLARLTRSPQTQFGGELSRLLGDGTLSAGSLPLLGMGRDIPDGVLSLRKGLLAVDWTTRTSEVYFARVRETMRSLAVAMDAQYVDNPMWFFRRIISVHPVGGAPMGRSPGEGVCDPYGEVFGHPGLWVTDGAAMPGPVGTNPSLTIAAHADRLATHLLEDAERPAANGARPARAGRRTDPTELSSRRRPASPAEGAASLSFTEEMKGFVGLGEADPKTGARVGKAAGQALMFHLTITAADADRFLSEKDHEATAVGWVQAAALGGQLSVQHGWFNLFSPGDTAGARYMRYRLYLTSKAGPLTLSGRKEVHDDAGLDVWRDTSTLYFRLLDGHVADPAESDAAVLGAGVLRILKADFVRQLTTIRAGGPRPAETLSRFGRFFLGQLWDVYGRHLPAPPEAAPPPRPSELAPAGAARSGAGPRPRPGPTTRRRT
jgi:cholesterol oxidase